MENETHTEQEEETLVSVGADGVVQPEAPKDEPEEKMSEVKKSQHETVQLFVRILCGGYLIYLAWKLIGGAINDFGAGQWPSSRIISVVGGSIFTIVGIGVIILAVKKIIQNYKETTDEAGE